MLFYLFYVFLSDFRLPFSQTNKNNNVKTETKKPFAISGRK